MRIITRERAMDRADNKITGAAIGQKTPHIKMVLVVTGHTAIADRPIILMILMVTAHTVIANRQTGPVVIAHTTIASPGMITPGIARTTTSEAARLHRAIGVLHSSHMTRTDTRDERRAIARMETDHSAA